MYTMENNVEKTMDTWSLCLFYKLSKCYKIPLIL